LLIVWWVAQPVVSSSLGTGLSWPYTLTVTLVPGAVVGLIEGALLRSPLRPIAGYVAMVCFSWAALWLPLVMLTFGEDVAPNDTSDVAVGVIIFGLFWLAMTVTALLMVAVQRAGSSAQTDATLVNGNHSGA